jgi:hypothetical protein
MRTKQINLIYLLFALFLFVQPLLFTGCNGNIKKSDTSADLIKLETAMENGSLSETEGSLQYLEIIFTVDQNDKTEYTADNLDISQGLDSARRYLLILASNYDAMTPSDQERALPFLLPPDDPESAFSPENINKSDTKNTSLFERLFSPSVVYALEVPWKTIEVSIDGNKDRVVVWYYTQVNGISEAQMKAKALLVKDTLETAWPKFKALLNAEPSKKFNVYLTDLTKRKAAPLGVAHNQLENNILTYYWISLEWTMNGDMLQSVAAHELFHIFQYQVMDDYKNTGAWWLQESTAVWSQNYIYPTTNIEQMYLSVFFNTLGEKMVDKSNLKDYASYPFFLFLSEKYGNDQLIADVITGSKGIEVEEYIMENIPDYGNDFSLYANYNWNQAPWKLYKDTGDLQTRLPTNSSQKTREIYNNNFWEAEEKLLEGAIRYTTFNIMDTDIEELVVDFTKTYFSENLSVTAALKIGNQWVKQNWTGKSEVTFNLQDQKISQIIMVTANGDLKNTASVSYGVDTRAKIVSTENNYTRITSRANTSEMSFTSEFFSKDQLVYDSATRSFSLKERAMTYKSTMSMKNEDVNFGSININVTGIGTSSESYENDSLPLRIELYEDGTGRLILDPEKLISDWVTYTTLITGGLPSSTEIRDVTNLQGPLTEIVLKPEYITKDRIKGKITIPIASEYGAGELDIEFDYDISN